MFSFLLGAVLLALAVPRTIAAVASLDANDAFDSLSAGKRPSDEALSAAAYGLAQSVAFVRSSGALVRLGEIELAQAGGAGLDKATRSDLLAKADDHLIAAVTVNPAEVYGWLSLAEVRIERDAGGRDIVAQLMQSLNVAPNMRLTWIPRAGLLLRYWQFLDREELPAFSAQIRTIWSASPEYRKQLIETAIGADEMEVVAAVVAEPPATTDDLRQMQGRKARRVLTR